MSFRRLSIVIASLAACACAETSIQNSAIAGPCVGTCIRLGPVADVDFIGGQLTASELTGRTPLIDLPDGTESATCRSDFLVGANGAVTLACVNCSDGHREIWQNVNAATRDMRFKPGADSRQGAILVSWPKTASVAAPAACDPAGAHQ